MKIDTDFGHVDQRPYQGAISVRDVDCEVTQNIDLFLPANNTWKIDRVESVPRIIPSAVTTKPKMGVSKWDGSVATQHRGPLFLHANSVNVADIVYAPGSSEGEYVYYQNIAAATNSGLITQVATLNTPGSATVVAQPDVPRKLRLVLVDASGADLAGTVTIVGKNQEGDTITEVITVAAGTVAYDTVNAFATVDSVAHNFGATGVVTSDTMDLGQDTSIAVPARFAEVIKLVTAGVEEAAATPDVPAGTFDPTTAPDGTRDYEIWYRAAGTGLIIAGGNWLRLAVTAGTVTGSDVRDFIVRLTKW